MVTSNTLVRMVCPRCWGSKFEPDHKDVCHYCGGMGNVADQQLSPHFALSEMLSSTKALRSGIPNDPSSSIIKSLTLLCTTVLEPIRNRFGSLHVDSGYRSHSLNVAVGGSGTSAHVYGLAADLVPANAKKKDVVDWLLKDKINFDQVIFEGTWVHVALGATGEFRKQALMMFFDRSIGKPRYYAYDPKDPRINT